MGGSDDPAAAASLPPQPPGGTSRKTYWRSVSWSASRVDGSSIEESSCTGNDMPWKCPAPPLTPRSLSAKARLCLPPLQPLAIAPRSLDEWPKAGSDDIGEWSHPPTPGSKPSNVSSTLGDGLKLDLSSFRSLAQKDQIAYFDKECSKVAEHIYLGGDCVARNRDVLHQNRITHILNCVGFVCPEYFKVDFVYRTLWLQDSPTEDITSILYDVFDYFEDVRENGGRIFVHCCQGVSRSTSLVIAYLMWREGQSFDDAFQFVKAARGIANPNMGFACQLLQCQKRVHAIPLSPNSLLRMFRIAPHSPYDPLHLVPKILSEPSPAALDSRGAFIIHAVSSIYVWIGMNCEFVMENDAKAAAFQVIRYEKIQGQFVLIKEREEPREFWDAFSTTSLGPDNDKIASKVQVDQAMKASAGKKKVSCYDAEFELFYKATTGGVVPPFSSSGPGHETHLPARESSWSELRRKRMSGFAFTNSLLTGDEETCHGSKQHQSAETSPPFLSPSSLSSDTTVSTTSSSGSPSFSPSTSSPPLLTLSPASNSPLQYTSDHLKLGNQGAYSPSKSPSSSIAERRGSFSPLKLTSLQAPTLPPAYYEKTEKADYSCMHENSSMCHAVDRESASSSVALGPKESDEIIVESHGNTQLLVYRWPNLDKLPNFVPEDLDSKAVYVMVSQNHVGTGEEDKIIYIWVGSQFVLSNHRNSIDETRIAVTDYWHQVGMEFLDLMGFSKHLPIKVVNECDPGDFLQLLETI